MTTFGIRLLLPVLALLACSPGHATVELDGVSDFGPVQSAYWLSAPVVDLWVIDSWSSLDASLEISTAGGTVSGTFDARLQEDASGEDAGQVHVEFHAPACTLDGVSTVVAY